MTGAGFGEAKARRAERSSSMELASTQQLGAEGAATDSQIGYLKICGATYPIRMGVNQIGRDPAKCQVILNMKSISRLHAVINILSANEHMIMDLKSPNKTRCGSKILSPFLPQPLRSGDVVQFGDVVGVFQLCDEEEDLPMTQVLDIPETPVRQTFGAHLERHVVPESPDMSDRDDSFIMPSQPLENKQKNYPKIMNPPTPKSSVTSKENDNNSVFWKAPSRSPSLKFELNDSTNSLNSSSNTNFNKSIILDDQNKAVETSSIHDMDTQIQQPLQSPYSHEDCSKPGSILNNTDNTNIHILETQLPYDSPKGSDIHNLETQIPDQLSNVSNIRKDTNSCELPNNNDIHIVDTHFHVSLESAEINYMDTQVPDEAIKEKNDGKRKITISPKVGKINLVDTQILDKSDRNTNMHNINNQETQYYCNSVATEVDNQNTQLESQKEDINRSDTHSTDTVQINNLSTGSINEVQTQIIKPVTIPRELDNNFTQCNESSTSVVIDKNASTSGDLQINNHDKSKIREHDNCKNQNQDELVNRPNSTKDEFNILKDNNDSDEEILFEEFDTQGFEMPDSQPLLEEYKAESGKISPIISPVHQIQLKINEINSNVQNLNDNKEKLKTVDESDGSTDCEDFFNTQTRKIVNYPKDDDLTDCEEADEMNVPQDNKTTVVVADMDITETCSNFNETCTQMLPVANNDNIDLEDMPTQILQMPKDIIVSEKVCNFKKEQCDSNDDKPEISKDISEAETQVIVERFVDTEDAPTQVIIINDNTDISDEPTQLILPSVHDVCDAPTQLIVTEDRVLSPFKIPSNVNRGKRSVGPIKLITTNHAKDSAHAKDSPQAKEVDAPGAQVKGRSSNDKKKSSYNNLLNSMGSPNESPGTKISPSYYDCTQDIMEDLLSQSEEVEPSSQGDVKVGERFPHITKNLPPLQVSNLENADSEVMYPKESTKGVSKDVSDSEETPKKNPIRFPDSLPDSQEIKILTSQNIPTTPPSTSDLSDSDQNEENSESQGTPIVYRKKSRKIKNKSNAKVDLAKRLEAESLPSRIITRIRKPTAKMQSHLMSNIVTKSNWTDEEVNEEIIKDNIAKLKESKYKSNKAPETIKTETRNIVDQFKSTEENVKKTPEKIKEIHKTAKVEEGKISKNPEKSSKLREANNKRKKKENKSTLNIKPKQKLDNMKEDSNSNKRNPSRKNKKMNTRVQSPVMLINSSDSDDNIPPKRSRTVKAKIEEDIKIVEELTHGDDKTLRRSRRQNIQNSQGDNMKTSIETVKNSAEKPIRLSIRQKTESSKNPADRSESQTRSTRLKKDSIPKTDESRVYSLIEKSDSDCNNSPAVGRSSRQKNPRKRPREEILIASPKSAKSTVSLDSPGSSARSTPSRGSMKHKKVLFTAYGDDVKMREMLEKLGATMVTEPTSCTVVVTRDIKRTFKLLCAIGLGKPIVGPSWLDACRTSNLLVEPWLYLLKDSAAEKRFKFDLEKTLSGPRKFLAGYNVSSTPGVMPAPKEMKLIVECSGGKWKEGGKSWLCVSVATDKALWGKLRERGATIVSSELILSGVLKQHLDVQTYKLA